MKVLLELEFGFKLLLDMFPVFKCGRPAQILFLEFIKDGPADNRDEFTFSCC